MTSTQQRPFAVVTGASSGIGFELAKTSAEEDDFARETGRPKARQGYDTLMAGKEDR